jgi:outer membrane lipoprotein-sorting protein
MRKVIVVGAILLSSLGAVFAQTDTKAKAILAQVSKKYRSYDIVKIGFTYTLENPQAKINETQSGTLYVKSKTNKFIVVLKEQELLSDGISQWTYLKADKEVQLNDVDTDPNSLNPAKVFTMYENGFKYALVGNAKLNNRVTNVIELTPFDTKRSFFKVRLNIDLVNKQLVKAVIFDKNGSRYTYTIQSFIPNVKVPETIFSFDPKQHPGVEVVDLR